jgi:Holliday junction resolvasome RuvABC DNA-binding subunit
MRTLDPGAPAADSHQASPPTTKGKAPKPMHRIVTYKCEDCLRGWREGRGRLVPITAADLALAACDAELVRELAPAVSASDAASDGDALCGDAAGGTIPRTKNGKVRTKRRPPPTTTIPKATRDFVWARDCGRCRVPGCRATRNIAAHHLRFLSHGGDHDPENIVLLCDGHHKLLHSGLLTITGRAPGALAFMRDGKRLGDTRSSLAVEADRTVRELAQPSDAGSTASRRGSSTRSRFDNVVTFEHAKQALMGLGFRARAARAALEEVCAHVGADADVAVLVKAVLDRQRSVQAARPTSTNDMQRDAIEAIATLGYTRSLAAAAVAAASAHAGADADLAGLIRDALRRCGSA